MKKTKGKQPKHTQQTSQHRLKNSLFKIPISDYSKQYKKYMVDEYPNVELMIKKIIQLPCCRYYYLKFPLQGLIRGVAKKMMLNTYQLIVFGFFLEKIQQWSVGLQIYLNLADVFPDIIHVNEPTNPDLLKQVSMFLYFSSYSIKQFLNNDMEIYQKEMKKIFPEFEHLHTHWVNNQHTVNFALNPRDLNQYYKKISKLQNSLIDYNTSVDKILQISPCYDLSNREEKKKLPDFGYMESENQMNNRQVRGLTEYDDYNPQIDNRNGLLYGLQEQQEQYSAKIEDIPGLDIGDLNYDGGDI